MRPLLRPYEDEDVWTIDQSRNSICSISNPLMSPPLDLSQISLNSLKERDVRRRYTDFLGTQQFNFDKIYSPSDTSQGIYEQTCKPIVHSVLSGYNGAIFMYGQTTSGKTYTMLGTPELPGVLPCAIRDIFKLISSESEYEFNIWVSYLEIYNEQINDLLSPGSSNLKIKEDKRFGVQIVGLTQHQVWSFDQVIMIMNFGEEHRMYRETSIHEHSSRSHTIFRVYVESVDKQGKRTFGCLNLVDLAGSERLNEFEVKEQEQLGETGHINRSLFVLAHVINKLAEGKQQHIPYRDSKLTRILQQALGGNSLAVIICTISPAGMNFHQTLSTLRFATRAKTVQNDPQINEITDDSLSIQQYKLEIDKLKSELDINNQNLVKIDKQNKDLVKQLQIYIEEANHYKEALKNSHIASENGDKGGEMKQLREKYNALVSMFEEEKVKKNLLESELRNQNKKFEEFMQSHKDTQKQLEDSLKNQRPVVQVSEGNFIENIVVTINTELTKELTGNKIWINKSKELCESYSSEIAALQDKYSIILSKILKEALPQQSAQQPENELPNSSNIFQDIHINFTTVLEEFLRSANSSSDLTEIMIDKLKKQHENLSIQIESRYEKARSSLENYYQKQVTRPELDAATITGLTAQHSDQLQDLRNQYENSMQMLEETYLDTLKVLDEFLSSEGS